MNRSGAWLVGILLLLIMGCAGLRTQEHIDRWNARVGVMTFDEAINLLGPPAAQAEGDTILVASWRAEQQSGAYVHHFRTIPGAAVKTISHGWEMQLTFDKTTRLLTDWTYQEW